MNRKLAFALLLLLAGVAVGQILPNGNRPPRNKLVTSPGGDFIVCGPVAILDARGGSSTVSGLHRVFTSNGNVETFVVILEPNGTKTGRWMPLVDAVAPAAAQGPLP